MPITLIKPAFSSGEVAPSLWSRPDLARHSTAAKTLKNFFVHVHGGASNRPGLRYKKEAKYDNKEICPIPFKFSTTQVYELEFGDYYVRPLISGEHITLDPYPDYVKLLLHCDGIDGSTAFTDETGKTVTASGTAAIDTAQSKFGGASCLLDGNSDYVYLADHADWSFGTGNFTVEFWVQFNATTAIQGLIQQRQNDDNVWQILKASANSISMLFRTGASTKGQYSCVFTPVAGTWYHMEFARNGTAGLIFINGVSQTVTETIAFGTNDVGNIAGTLRIGYYDNTVAGTYYLNGWVDEVRISKGICRHTASFTPATVAYTYAGDAAIWATGLSYIKGNYVSSGEVVYFCEVAHTSGTFATDLAAGKWTAQDILEIVTPYAEADLAELDYEQSADVLFLAHPDYLPRQLNRLGAKEWEMVLYPFTGGPFLIDNTEESKTLALTGLNDAGGSKTKLLVHWDGADAATAYTSEDYGARTATFAGNAQLDTAQKKFGTASLLLDGTGDYVTFPDSGDWAFGKNDFTIDCRICPNATPSSSGIIDLGAYNCVAIRLGSATNATVHIQGAAYTFTISSLSNGTWYHLALVRSGTSLKLYLNGVQQGTTQASAQDITGTGGQGVYIGYEVSGSAAYFNGWIDEIRIVNGKAIWLADFTPPTAAYDNTLVLTASGFTFDDGHEGALFKLRHYVGGQAVTANLTATGATTTISCYSTWRLITHGTWTATIRIEKSTDSGENWTMLREFSSVNDYNASAFGTEDLQVGESAFLLRINCTAFTSGTININLSADPYYQEGIVEITEILTGSLTTRVNIKKPVGSTDATIDWAEGAWSTYRGFPSTVKFQTDDRLAWANTYHSTNDTWLTRSSNYYDFSRSDPLIDSDGITAPLPEHSLSGIQYLVPLSELVVLTKAVAGAIESTTGAGLTPTTTHPRIYEYEGAAKVRPVMIGNRAIFVQMLGAAIRDIGYEQASLSFNGSEISVMAKHLLDGYQIVDMAYQRHPDRLLWAIRSDGKLLSLTYMREQDIIAWTQHDTNESGASSWATSTVYVAGNWVLQGGETYYCLVGHTAGAFATDLAAAKWEARDIAAHFERLCVVPGTDYDEVYFSVKRGTKRYIEILTNRYASTAVEDQFFVDCGGTYDGTPISTLTGLTRFNGLTISVLADGNWLGLFTVASGQITLPDTYSVIQYGIPYVSDLIPLNIELVTNEGTMQAKRIKISLIALYVINSKGGYIGKDEDSLFPLRGGLNDSYNTGTALYSGFLKNVLSGGYSDDGDFLLRQSAPLPITVASVIPTVTPGGMSTA